jgi:hypothetical protein
MSHNIPKGYEFIREQIEEGLKLNTPTPEVYPPPPPPPTLSDDPSDTTDTNDSTAITDTDGNKSAATQEIFSRQKGQMDYINWKDIQRKIGITKATAILFILKQLLDNAVDYIETHYTRLADGIPLVEVKIIKPHNYNYLKLVVINANDGTPVFNERKIRLFFDPNSKVSSKRNQFKINKGALGDALKEVLGIPYALARDAQEHFDRDSERDIKNNDEWNEPLILRNNSINEEFQVSLTIDRIKQDIGLHVEKIPIVSRHAIRKDTTEIEVRLPLFDDNINALLVYLYQYFEFVTHVDFTLEYIDEDNDKRHFIEAPHTQLIEKSWKSHTSVYYYTFAQFRDFILELDDDRQIIYDVLYKVFREGSNMPKKSLTQVSVVQIKRSEDYMGELYQLLRDSMDPPSILSLPFNVKSKTIRTQAIIKAKSNEVVGQSFEYKIQVRFWSRRNQ